MSKKKWAYCIGLIISGFLLFLYLDYINWSVAFDDAYSLKLSQRSFSDIFKITSQDVHPPLYYWMLKIFSSIFGYSAFSGRIFSNIGILALLIFGALTIRKRFGERSALLFVVLLIVFPVTQFAASEIRMYSWTMFFTFASTIYAYDSYYKGRGVDYLKFGVFALCAAYTHYYALMTSVWIFVILFVALLYKRKSKLRFVITVFLFALLYSPWLSHLFFQVKQVNDSYWIAPLVPKDVFYHIYYFFSIKKDWLSFDSNINSALMLGTAVIILLQSLIVVYVIKMFLKTKEKQYLKILLALCVFVLPIVSGIAFSLLVRSVLVPRYMLCSFSLLLLGLAMAYDKCWGERKLRIFVIVSIGLLALSSAIRYYGTTNHLVAVQREVKELDLFLDRNSAKTKSFLAEHYSASALSRMSVLSPEKECYILTYRQSKETFAPFDIDKVYHDEFFMENFILVQKSEHEAGKASMDFKKIIIRNFIVTDSIKVLGMELYKVGEARISR